MRRNGGKLKTVEQKLILVQLFLVLPVLVIFLTGTIYAINKDAANKINSSRNYLLQTISDNFENLYDTARKLLEKPYTNSLIYANITKTYAPHEQAQRSADNKETAALLYKDILYFDPNISSITIVSESNSSVVYKHVYPVTGVNPHAVEWPNVLESEWYIKTIQTSEPVIFTTTPNEFFNNSGITVSLSQRLLRLGTQQRIGAIRLDLNIGNFFSRLENIQTNTDTFLVLDSDKKLVYSNDADFLSQHQLLSAIEPDTLEGDFILNSYFGAKSHFTFITLTDKTLITGQSGVLYGLVALFAVLYAAISITYIFWSARRFSQPIRTLKAVMLRGSLKDFSVQCPPLSGEMGVLGDAFNSLMETINLQLEEIRTKEHETAQLSYEVLQSKINPHFLYNTLNAVRWKAQLIGAKDIAISLESLASLLKFSIKCTTDLIPFSMELEQLENYIRIMYVRYGNDIEIDYDIDESCYEYMCPKFMIQPAVENAYLHAFLPEQSGEKLITVTVRCLDDCIEASVRDNGRGMTPEAAQSLLISKTHTDKKPFSGIGIFNVHQRIRSLFGTEYGVTVDSVEDKYTEIRAIIPKITAQTVSDCDDWQS